MPDFVEQSPNDKTVFFASARHLDYGSPVFGPTRYSVQRKLFGSRNELERDAALLKLERYVR